MYIDINDNKLYPDIHSVKREREVRNVLKRIYYIDFEIEVSADHTAVAY
jgi:hypothetical protein